MLFAKLSNKRTVVPITIVVLVLLFTLVVYAVVSLSQPSYVGADAKLSKADNDSTLEIDDAVLSIPPKVKSGVQAAIQITKFAGNYAQGIVSYSDKSSTQQFMAVKVGNNWTIVTHNSGESLNFPDVKTARQYSLPKDWFKS